MNFAERYGPWAVIAGASEGTGRSFAQLIASRGVNCILLGRREEPLRVLVREIRERSPVECVTGSIDLSATDAMERIVALVGPREVGLLVLNAGADPNGSQFLDRDIGSWLDLAQRNVMATMCCCHHFAGSMKLRGRGGLLLVNSGACYGGAPYMAAYAGTKAFGLCFGDALWAELQPHGVDVLTLVLGQTDTPAFRKLLADKGMPVPDKLASPEDVATVGLGRLAQGPVHHWGLADDEAGYAPSSAAARRARIGMVASMTRRVFGGG